MPIDYLVVRSGEHAGAELHPGLELVIGRGVSGPGLLDGDPLISQRHARLVRRGDGGVVIEDLGSSNGTYVNGDRISGPRELGPSDVVRIGATMLEARGAEPVEQSGSPAAHSGAPATPGAPLPAAALLYEGRRIDVPSGGVSIGRTPDNDVAITAREVSRHHARIVASGGRYYVADLGSANATGLNGERLQGESRWLTSGDTIEVGGRKLRFLVGAPTRIAEALPAPAPQRVHLAGPRLTLGRDPGNDVVLDDPNVSRFHAEIVRVDSGAELRDLASRNGTRIDGAPVRRARLQPGSEVGVGPFRLVYDGTTFVQRDDRGALRLRADALSIQAGEKTILHDASLAVEPGELVVVIGESGSGKSTMIKALAGVPRPSSGTVTINGEPVASRLTDLGYVPQDDIVHRHLTVRESLRYSARLRLPHDSTAADIDAAVDRVLGELRLGANADTLIAALSGGQRKRTSVATELLNRPSLLFLDEPTTGMDPGLETRMMRLFRDLAEEGTRAVLVVTHATKNLDLADKVVVMGRGGELTFLGRPYEALRFFDVGDYDGIYQALERRPAVEWRRDFEAARRAPADAGSSTGEDGSAGLDAPRRRAPAALRPRTGPQAGVLARRYATLLARDRRNLAILLGQVPVFGLGIALLFRAGALGPPGRGRPRDAAQIVFLLVITVVWVGLVDGSREIVKERALFERERSVGVGLGAYLISKATVLFPLLAIQTALLLLVVLVIRPAGESPKGYAGLFAILALIGFVSVTLGLLVSCVVSTEDQATSLLPLMLIPQLLFAGAIAPLHDIAQPMRTIADLMPSRWAYAGAGAALDMNERIAGDPQFARLDQFGPSFFDLSVPGAIALQLLFMALLAAVVAALLRRDKG